MPVRVTLRTDGSYSPFRRMLLRLAEAPGGDSLILCSGYVWEHPTRYSILGDGLLSSLSKGCSSGTITTIAGKLSGRQWSDYYKNFVRKIRSAGLTVKSYKAKRNNWHAKIAIRMKGETPVAALVGSSNLTGPAYRISGGNWNFEGDVLIWPPNASLSAYFRKDFDPPGPFIDMHLKLDSGVRQQNEGQQLKLLYRNVMNSGLELIDVGR